MLKGENDDQVEGTNSHRALSDVGSVAVCPGRLVDRSRNGNGNSGHHNRGSLGRALAVSLVILIVAGCSPYYDPTRPGPKVPPAVVGMEWADESTGYDADCLLGLAQDGLTFIAGAGTPWGLGGVAAEWLSYKITGSVTPVGEDAGTCWKAVTENSTQFALYLQCYGEPYIKYWYDNMDEAQKSIAIPRCVCDVACMGMSNGSTVAAYKGQIRASNRQIYCQINYFLDLSCQTYSSPNGGWKFGPGPNIVTTGDPVHLPDEPLPADWNDPWWDVNKPIPEGAL